jgi:hypothetical protein
MMMMPTIIVSIFLAILLPFDCLLSVLPVAGI